MNLFTYSALISQIPAGYEAFHTTTTFNNKAIDVNLAVGATAGAAGVSNGAATYSIPLMSPPRPKGAKQTTSVSISYSSTSGDGQLGRGWNINAGVSIISRTQLILGQDEITNQSCTASDEFTLDGNRLICDNYVPLTPRATIEYWHTKNENFASIISYRDASASRNIYMWDVFTKDGNQYRYGTLGASLTAATNSTGNNTTCNSATSVYTHFYLLSITSNINIPYYYCEFEYENYRNPVNTCGLNYKSDDKITTLKKVIDNYGSTEFIYKGNRIDEQHTYTNGKLNVLNELLDYVVVKDYNGVLLRKYNFKYNTDFINSYLSEIQEEASNGAKLNPTIFKYGDRDVDYLKQTQSQNITLNIPFNDNDLTYQSGDFNGDGFTDIMVLSNCLNCSKPNTIDYISIFINDKNNNYTAGYSQYLSTDLTLFEKKDIYRNLYVSDYDGNGVDDIILHETNGAGDELINSQIYFFDKTGNPNIVTKPVPSINGVDYKYVLFNNKYNFFQSGDFDGDGNQDYMIITSSSGWYQGMDIFMSYPSKNIYNEKLYNNPTFQIPDELNLAERIIILDFNGDGKSDIMVIKSDNTVIYNIDPIWTVNQLFLNQIYSNTYPSKDHLIYTGDFNGDKKTDLLTKVIGTHNWETRYSTGNNFESINCFTYFPTNAFGSPEYNTETSCEGKPIISDYNGDGKSDILYIEENNQNCNSANIRIHYSGTNLYYKTNANSSSPVYIKNNYCHNTLAGDFNGDGKSDINIGVKGNLVSSSPCENNTSFYNLRKHIYFDEDGNELVLEKVKNGLGLVSEFSYQTLTKFADYQQYYPTVATTSYNGNKYILAPLKVVTSYKNEDQAGMHEISFKYKGALLNSQGYGLLGYREIESIDNLLNRKQISYTNKFNSSPANAHVLIPDFNETYRISDNLLLQSNKQLFDFVIQPSGSLWLKKTREESYSYLTGNTSKDITYDATINNNEIKTVTTNQLGHIEEINYNYGTTAALKPPLPELITSTRSRSGLPSISYTTKYEYDFNFRVKKKFEFWGQTNNIKTEYEYTDLGLVKKEIITGNGVAPRFTEYFYDDPLNNLGLYLTQTKNSLGQSTTYTLNQYQEPLTVTGIDGLTTIYEYDIWGRKTKTTSPSGKVINESISWDNSKTNNVGTSSLYKTSVSSANSLGNSVYYDKLSRIVVKQLQIGNGDYTYEYPYYDIRGNNIETSLHDQSGALISKSQSDFDDFGRSSELRKFDKNGTSVIISNTTYTKSGNYWETTTTTPTTSISNPLGSSSYIKTTLNDELVETSQNSKNTLTYQYNADGKNTKVMQGSTVLTNIIYDAYGRKLSMTDNSAGLIKYEYTPLGELYKQTNANNGFIRYTYDVLGRKTQELINEGSINYTYFPSGSGAKTNKIKKVTGYQLNASEEFDYDMFGRLNKVTTKVSNTTSFPTFITEYTYNTNNDIIQKISPTGNIYNYNYNTLGVLSNITRGSTTIYNNPTFYSSGALKSYDQGTNMVTKDYDNFGHIKSISSSYIDDEYVWDPINLNLISKNERKQNFDYAYTYDNFDRLTNENLITKGIQNGLRFHDNGNIAEKESAALGDPATNPDGYHYHTGKQFAVKNLIYTDITSNNSFPGSTQNITYSSFNRPTNISQGGKSVGIQYNANYDRSCATFNFGNPNNPTKLNRYYIGNSEIEYNYLAAVNTFKQSIDYVYAGDELIALDVKTGSNTKTWYVNTDYQGTIRAVFDNQGSVYYQNFDAWGSPRDLITGNLINNAAPSGLPDWLYRGYTGHEHYYDFGLINMNARLYDPHNSRMLGPDICVGVNTLQGFNRYSYANNNPLKYTDPSGNFITWSIGTSGFSIGFNLSPIGIPLGAGINIGWSNGLSAGLYGELGLRVGGTGLGSGATLSQSLGYNFKSNAWSTSTSIGIYASLSGFSVSASISESYSFADKKWGTSWRVSFGVGDGNDERGGANSVGFGSDGWDFSIGGYYNSKAWESNPEYDPWIWDDNVEIKYQNNCYSYALDDPFNTLAGTKPQPGQYSGQSANSHTLEEYANAAIRDGKVIKPTFFNKLGFGKKGYYSVYLVLDNVGADLDYHWYRQDKGGLWSQKHGHGDAVRQDGSGNYINNPARANHNYGDGLNYNNGGILLWRKK